VHRTPVAALTAAALTAAALVAATLAVTGCSSGSDAAKEPDLPRVSSTLPVGGDPVQVDPANFVAAVTNPWWPMPVGARWVYRETDGEGTVTVDTVEVTGQTKVVAGVRTTVVHDVARESGKVVEDTYDYYAQDVVGNVWYFGEDTTAYDGSKSSTAGSWLTGRRGAMPGVVVPADPRPGLRYRQEYDKGHAEDAGLVVRLDASATVPYGHFTGLLQTRDTSPLEPKLVERKLYARGIGPLLDEEVAGGSDHGVLVTYRPAG
jgi:hypothetical protein